MKRDLAALASNAFDLLVIGGGVVGACVARDAARRNLRVALIEQNDFASAASEAMSHTIHGGIRYLSSGQFDLIRTGLRERSMWLRTAPGFVTEQPWLMPLTGGWRAVEHRMGVALYQWLGGKRARTVSRQEAIALEPLLAMEGLSGAAWYVDGRLDDPHALVIAVLQDAAAHGAVIANHVEAMALRQAGSQVAGVGAVDLPTGANFNIQARIVVNATGPWAQRVAERLSPGQKSVRLTMSKGIHLIAPPMQGKCALALAGRGEHAFIVPWHGMSLIGTTDDAFSGDPADIKASDADIEALKAKVLRLLPGASPLLAATRGIFAGLRALPAGAGGTYRAARETMLADHAADGAAGLFTLTGGKWTTARLMAERALDAIAPKSGQRLAPCDTATALIAPAPTVPMIEHRLARARLDEMALTRDDSLRRLGRHALLADEALGQKVDQWLASSDNGANNASGRDGRLS
jgi:glycerol-3-phosphate dehydrogenase